MSWADACVAPSSERASTRATLRSERRASATLRMGPPGKGSQGVVVSAESGEDGTGAGARARAVDQSQPGAKTRALGCQSDPVGAVPVSLRSMFGAREGRGG